MATLTGLQRWHAEPRGAQRCTLVAAHVHVVHLLLQRQPAHQVGHARLGFGRTVVSETEAPNIFANVWYEVGGAVVPSPVRAATVRPASQYGSAASAASPSRA